MYLGQKLNFSRCLIRYLCSFRFFVRMEEAEVSVKSVCLSHLAVGPSAYTWCCPKRGDSSALNGWALSPSMELPEQRGESVLIRCTEMPVVGPSALQSLGQGVLSALEKTCLPEEVRVMWDEDEQE